MVAITGKSGSGKTYFISLLKNKNYKVFIGDEYNKKIYSKNQKGYKILKEKIGLKVLDQFGVDMKKLRKWLSEDFDNNLSKLRLWIEPLHLEHLKKNKYDFAELAIIEKQSPFADLFSDIVFLKISEIKRKANLIGKRKMSLLHFEKINKKIAANNEGKHFFTICIDVEKINKEKTLEIIEKLIV